MRGRDDFNKAVRNIIRDIKVELGDEFDRNFEREAFFSQAWKRRKSPMRPGGHLLVNTGGLRRSVRSVIKGNGIVFQSDHPAASIHNEGGEIKVTERMKRYFWARYYEATGAFGRKKDGSLRNTKKNHQLGSESEFWKTMALMPAGKSIVMPRRQFIGESPEVERMVRAIIEENIEEYLNSIELT